MLQLLGHKHFIQNQEAGESLQDSYGLMGDKLQGRPGPQHSRVMEKQAGFGGKQNTFRAGGAGRPSGGDLQAEMASGLCRDNPTSGT